MVKNETHSGIQGYCEASAELRGVKAGEEPWSPYAFAEELLPGRYDPALKKPQPLASRTWTLSPIRKSGSRFSAFEKTWLNGEDAEIRKKTAVEAMKKHAGRNLSEDEKAQCEGKAEFDCEKDAINSCIRQFDDNFDESMIYGLVWGVDQFALRFHADILPAIRVGFIREGFKEPDIMAFSNAIDQLADEINYDDLLQDDGRPRLPLRTFIRTLFAALIYGPEHPLARNQPFGKTFDYSRSRQTLDFDWNEITVMHLIERHAAYVGESLTFGTDTAIFIGRSADEAAYLEKCREVFPAEGEIFSWLKEREIAVFNVLSSYTTTSGQHGLILFNGNLWEYYDLDSMNGTAFQRDGDIRKVSERLQVLRPGDIIYLGKWPNTPEEELPGNAASLLVSCHVDSRNLRFSNGSESENDNQEESRKRN